MPFSCLYFYFWRGLNVKTIFIFHYDTHYDGFGDRHITLVPKEHGMASPIIILIFNSTLKDNLITKTKTFFPFSTQNFVTKIVTSTTQHLEVRS